MDIKKLREEFASVHSEAMKLVEAGATRDLTADEISENAKRFARLEKIKSLIEDNNKFAKMALEAGDVQLPAEMPGVAEFEAVERPAKVDAKNIDKQEFSRAATDWLSTGRMASKFATITTATATSLLLPVSVVGPVAPSAPNTFRQAFAVTGLPVTYTTSTTAFNVPVFDGSAGGEVAQDVASESENVPTVTESILSRCKVYQSGYVGYSNMELKAVDFDLLGATTPAMQYSKELGLEAAIAAAIIADAGITQSVTAATTSSITVANLDSLNNKLPKRYQFSKVIMLSADAYAAACTLAFSSGPKVLSTDANGVKRFDGTPVLRCDYLEAFGASKKIGLVLSMSGFHLRDAGEQRIARLTDVFGKTDQTFINLIGYHAYGYSASALAKLVTPST